MNIIWPKNYEFLLVHLYTYIEISINQKIAYFTPKKNDKIWHSTGTINK